MPLIKNIRARELVNNAVVMNLGDVREEADSILERARREAAAIVAEARAEAERLVAGAAERGFAEGVARGEAEGRAAGMEAGSLEGAQAAEAAVSERFQALGDGWTEALEAFIGSREELREQARRDLLRLSLAIAERVLGRLPACDPTLVVDQLEAAMQMLTGATALRVRIHPDDLPIVERHFERAVATMNAAGRADVVFDPDEQIVRGGCLVSAGDGEVDARLDVQISRIVGGLFPELLESPEQSDDPPTIDEGVATVAGAADHAGSSGLESPEAFAPETAGPESTDAADSGAVDSWDDIAPPDGADRPDPEETSE
ncbi:MAG: FliH/SctL family protein [Planctomycetota bacterium]|nr:FliH/SctL family protein [Planctomycetota bacterium]